MNLADVCVCLFRPVQTGLVFHVRCVMSLFSQGLVGLESDFVHVCGNVTLYFLFYKTEQQKKLQLIKILSELTCGERSPSVLWENTGVLPLHYEITLQEARALFCHLQNQIQKWKNAKMKKTQISKIWWRSKRACESGDASRALGKLP